MLSTDASLKAALWWHSPCSPESGALMKCLDFYKNSFPKERYLKLLETLRVKQTNKQKTPNKTGKVAALCFAPGFCRGTWGQFLQSGERAGMPLCNMIFTSSCFSENQANRGAQKTFLRKKYYLHYAPIRSARGFGAQQGSQALFDFRTYGWSSSCTCMHVHTHKHMCTHACMQPSARTYHRIVLSI